MSREQLGIVAGLQQRRVTFAKFFYRAPEAKAADVNGADLAKLEQENSTLKGRLEELENENVRLRERVYFKPPSAAKPDAVASLFCQLMRDVGYEVEGGPYAIEHLTTPRRAQILARPRHVFMWVARRACSGHSLPAIGRFLGNRDHTTVMHGCHKAPKVMREDATLRGVALAVLKTFGVEMPE